MRPLCLLLALFFVAPTAALAQGGDFGEPSGPRRDGPPGGDADLRFILVAGTIERPDLREIARGDPILGALATLDSRGGIAREMVYYRRLSRGRPLIVCVTDRPNQLTAAHSTAVPLDHAFYMRWEIPLLDGSKLSLQEPCPLLVFPIHVLKGATARELTRTLKHELGHVLQSFKSFINEGGLEESFGAHNLPLRTNGRTALSEGFAEFSALRFRDSDQENDPRALEIVLGKRNQRAHRMMLAFYFLAFRSREAVSSRVPAAVLDGAQKRLFAELKRRSGIGSPLALSEFRAAVVTELVGRGRPPLKAAELENELNAHERDNAPALARLKDEELGSEERGRLEAAYASIAASPAASRASVDEMEDLLDRTSPRGLRSAAEMLTCEGVVAKVLLELDRELSADGIDFYDKLLGAFTADPYGGRSEPKEPVNLKELLASLDRDPELKGKIFPVVSRATKGGLRAEHFRLEATREEDPLDAPMKGSLEEQFAKFRRQTAKPKAETSPGFEELRSR